MYSYLDAIAALGKGSLHPGGFSHTLEVLRTLSIKSGDVVLDIGCGTGRTACHLAKATGAHVFALDNSQVMLNKAKSRASQAGVEVRFILADAACLPVHDEVVDFVLIESVLIFLAVPDVLRECYRVLKRKGVLVSIEMLTLPTLPEAEREKIKRTCGLPQMPSLTEWIAYFEEAGFDRAIVKKHSFPGFLDNLKEMLHPDPYQVVSKAAKTNWELKKVIFGYKKLMLKNRRHLGFGTFILTKD